EGGNCTFSLRSLIRVQRLMGSHQLSLSVAKRSRNKRTFSQVSLHYSSSAKLPESYTKLDPLLNDRHWTNN
ncbi:mCG145835, partial [Mus musculus]